MTSEAVTEEKAEPTAEPGPETAAQATAEAAADTAAETATDPATEDPVADDSPAPGTLKDRLKARLAHWRSWRTRHPARARALYWTTTALAALLVLVALLMPHTVGALQYNRFTRLPAEAIVLAVVMLALPRRPRIVVAALSGVVLGALTVLNLLDMGFSEYLGRGFNLVLDWELLDDAQAYVEDSMGRATAIGAAVGRWCSSCCCSSSWRWRRSG